MPERVSAEHIASYGAGGIHRFEPQRVNNFTIRFTLPGGIQLDKESIIAMSVKTFPFPQEETDVLEIAFGNEIRKIAGVTKFSNEQLTVHDYVDSETADIIAEWRRLVYNAETGVVGYASEYKSEGDLLMFGPDGNKIRTWRLYGLWPRRVRYGKGEMSTSAVVNEVEVEFALDKYAYLGSNAA